MLSLEGKQLGNYDVIRRIRAGGMGAVYEGRQRTAFGRRVAIKVILGDYASDRDMRRRFAREARTIARLHHPHILPLIEFGDEQGILYLVMPYIEGGTLTGYLRRTLPELGEVAAIYLQLLDAVEYAHDEGLIHRDIKSSNVLLEPRRSSPPYIYLADFGLVRTARQGEQNQPGKPIPLDQVPGTPHYMAPEQTRGIITPATDIYALGVLLYQMLTGELPYNDPDDVRVIQMHLHAPIPLPGERDASIPSEMDEVVRRAMAKRPEARFGSVAALREAFLAAMKGPVAPMQEDDTPPVARAANHMRAPASSSIEDNGEQIAALEQHTEHGPPSPAPIVIPQRPRREAPPVALREQRPSRTLQRITEDNRDTRRARINRYRPRITEEPAQRRRRRFVGPALATMAVPTILLILLIMPRALGVSLFPPGFPLFGTPPVATVLIRAQSKLLQDRYVLTASPQVQAPNLATHTIPDRVLSDTETVSKVVQTTGTQPVGGAVAHGTLIFTNSSEKPFSIAAGTVLTSTTGVQVQLAASVVVPPRQNGNGGKAQAPAVALTPGAAGNVPANTINGPCCSSNGNIMVRNPAPFSGGADAQNVPVVAQADLDGVRNTLAPSLQQKVAQQIRRQVSSGEVMAGQPAYTITVSASSPVGAQVAQVQVTVKVAGAATAYNRTIVEHTAMQLLSKQAAQALGRAYHLQGAPVVTSAPTVQPGKNGILYLSVPVSGLWVYDLTQQQMAGWRQSIRGATPAVALAYLNAQPGVAGVEIHLPFGADHLPTDINEIKVSLVRPDTS
jgi:serine/threonine protein kinase